MSTTSIRVTNAQELKNAIETASAGDTIRLADGDYGDLSVFRKEFSEKVTLQAENSYGARFTSVTLREADGFHFDGIQADKFTANFGIDNMSLTNSRVFGSVLIREANDVVLQNNDIGGSVDNIASRQGLTIFSVSDFSITGNYIHHFGEDLFRVTGDSNGGLIEGNFLYDVVAASAAIHADLFQMFGAHGKTPHDIVIRNNVAIDDVKTGVPGAQGFFFTDAQGVGYQDLLVENNIIMSGAPNSLTIRDATENVQFFNNTIIGNDQGQGGSIRLGGDNSGLTVDGNLHKFWYSENSHGATILDNHAYGQNKLTDVIRGADRLDWQSYLPAAHTEAGFGSHYGAQGLLKALLLGASGNGPAAPTERPVDADVAFAQGNTLTMRGLMDNRIQTIAHTDDLALDQGTISFKFNPATTKWARTVFSKEGAGDGDSIALVVRQDKLFLYLEDGKLNRMVELMDLKAGQAHDFQLSFDGTHVKVAVDGVEKAILQSDFTLSDNTSDLVIGARNDGVDGQAKLYQPWHGTISDFIVHDKALTVRELAQIKAGEPVYRLDAAKDAIVADPGSPFHWLLEQTKNKIDLKDFALDKNGNVVDISIEARTHQATAVFEHTDDLRFNGGGKNQKVIAHNDAMELDEGTIAIDFRTSVTKYHRTLVSKESSDMGNDVSVWVKGGVLYVQVQDGETTQQITAAVSDHTTYDLKIGFDGEKVVSWLNGQKIGEVESGFNLAENSEALIIGGGNGAHSGKVAPSTIFHGDVYDVGFFSETLLKDGTLPTTVTPIKDMNLGHTPWLDTAPPQASRPGLAQPEEQPGPELLTPEFAFADEIQFNGAAGSAVVLAHDESMEISEGVLAVNFSTSLTNHHRTLLSKESGELGNDIEIWVKNGKLHIEVEDGDTTRLISTNVGNSSNYDLKVGFDGKHVSAWLNDTKIGEVNSGFDMSQNTEALIIGAGNGGAHGKVELQTSFHGHVYSVELYGEDALQNMSSQVDDFLF